MTTLALHDRLRFDVDNGQVLDADRRYVLLRADVLMGLFEGLSEGAAEDALAALRDSVNRYGSASVRAYDNRADSDPAALLASVAAGAASLGWGRWHIELDGTTCRLRVVNSPFARARRVRGEACAAIVGMFSAACSHIWQEPVLATEVHCSACGARSSSPEENVCTFEATRQPST
ncbi:4-vinyl reductase [Variovorax paradoxus]|uniref:4-vinyl reductase n=1 Tax=Variovorax paradoxus TaxID=34073 RepID=UPI0012D3B3BA|nr:4-vinyl reductase [Variovorax paradoxus]